MQLLAQVRCQPGLRQVHQAFAMAQSAAVAKGFATAFQSDPGSLMEGSGGHKKTLHLLSR
jgi:hypothetical protein